MFRHTGRVRNKRKIDMFSMPNEILTVLNAFSPLFSTVVWGNAMILVIGAILCNNGNRTVTSCLRVMGLEHDPCFTNYHRVLNRAKWNTLQASKILLGLLILLVPPGAPLIIGVDETIERRKGKRIKAKGVYRDAVRSSEKHVVKCFGLKWISMMLIVALPWAKRCWALPFLTVLAPSEAYNKEKGKRHKTTVDWTRQMIMQVSRWVANRTIILVGDGAYAAVALARCCSGLPCPVFLVSRLRLDAALYDPPPPPVPGKRGRKPKKGERQPCLAEVAQAPSTVWSSMEMTWYDGVKRTIEFVSAVSLWYTPGQDPVAIRRVLTRVRDKKGKVRTEAFFSTDLEAKPEKILHWFILRWNVEVTFEELRTHLGCETQRQWSEPAIQRTTPVLFALFSLVTLMALEIIKTTPLPIRSFAWYHKSEATFSDVIALVRRTLWTSRFFTNSQKTTCHPLFPQNLLKPLMDLLCSSA
jgi:hypothetical protein